MTNHLHRRTFLQSTGVSLALPLLGSMRPSIASAQLAAPRRMVAICTTLGLHSPALWPKTTGESYETTEYLTLLKEHRADFTLLSGLAHEHQAGRQPHNCEMTWLTGAHGPGLDGFRNTVSLDQFAASHLGKETRFPSVTLGSNTAQSQSYTSSGVMIPAETSPANLFAKLFLQSNPREVARQKRMLNEGASILDQLKSQRDTLRRTAGNNDNRQLDEYFDSIRQAEKNISEANAWLDKPKPVVHQQPPQDISDGADLVGRVKLMMSLIPLILQSDSSRVVTLMIQDHKVVPRVAGVTGEHHNLSHHGQEESKINQLKKIEAQLLGCFSTLLGQLKDKSETGQRLLDQTSVLFGSNLGNANAHDFSNLPIFLAGGGFKHGRFVSTKNDIRTSLSNLFVTMLQKCGIESDAFADSTGTLSSDSTGTLSL